MTVSPSANRLIVSCRPSDRNHKDVDVISLRLKRVELLDRLPTSVLQQLAFYGYYEDLEKGVTCKYRIWFLCRLLFNDVV